MFFVSLTGAILYLLGPTIFHAILCGMYFLLCVYGTEMWEMNFILSLHHNVVVFCQLLNLPPQDKLAFSVGTGVPIFVAVGLRCLMYGGHEMVLVSFCAYILLCYEFIRAIEPKV